MIDLSTVVGFDTETTGVFPHSPDVRVVTCSFIRQVNNTFQELNWIMDPEMEIPTGASDVHGITTEKARAEGMDYRQGMQEIANALAFSISQDIPIVAYNASFDITLLREEFKRVSISFDESLWDRAIIIDPYVMDVTIDQYRKGGHTLGTVAKLYGYDLENAHEASADVYATLAILHQIVPKFIEFVTNTTGQKPETFDDLMAIQPIFYHNYKQGLENFFRRKDPNKTINKSWPFADPEED